MIARIASFTLGIVAPLALVGWALFLHLDRHAVSCQRRRNDLDYNQDKHSIGAAIVAVLVLTGTISLLYAPLFL